jgi:hypothetical protein
MKSINQNLPFFLCGESARSPSPSPKKNNSLIYVGGRLLIFIRARHWQNGAESKEIKKKKT